MKQEPFFLTEARSLDEQAWNLVRSLGQHTPHETSLAVLAHRARQLAAEKCADERVDMVKPKRSDLFWVLWK